MTEKELIEKVLRTAAECRVEDPVPTLRHALTLAKEHGAKFDPEPVKLRPLRFDAFGGIIRPKDTADFLSEEEQREIVRRCNLWDTIRALTEGPGSVIGRQFLRQMMDGREL